MMIRARAGVIAILCGLTACTTANHDPSAGQAPPASRAAVAATAMETAATADEAAMAIPRALIAPSPKMLEAALTNDPDAMRDALVNTATSCQASSTCPAQFASCTGWSTPSVCSSTCGQSFCICRPVRLCDGDPPEPKGVDTYNSFRVCFDPNQNACTEWSNTTTSFCGC